MEETTSPRRSLNLPWLNASLFVEGPGPKKTWLSAMAEEELLPMLGPLTPRFRHRSPVGDDGCGARTSV